MPALSLTVTPGTVFAEGDAVTADLLNLAANPGVTLPTGSVQPEHLDTDALVAEIGDSLRAENYCPWGTFHEDRFVISGTVSAADGISLPVHPGWYVRPVGAAVNVAAAGRSVASESNEAGRCGVKVFGHASLTSVVAGTYLPPGLTQMLSGGNMTFSCYVYNGAGTSFTPSLEIYTGATAGDEGNVSLVSTVSASAACAAGQWTRVEFDFDASGVTNFNKGAHLRVKATVSTGAMDSGSDYFILADAQIDAGVTSATVLKRQPIAPDWLPAGLLLPWGAASTASPPGYLFCDGSAVSRARYARLFAVVGTAYGSGDGSTTFNLPDGRGRAMVGAEIAGSSQSRMEVSISVSSHTAGTDTLTVSSTAGLRLGMSGHGSTLAGETITELTATTIKLSASVASAVTGTVRFSKLGGGDAQTLGAAGTGMAGKRRKFTVVKSNCTASGTTLTVPSLRGLACGMTVSGTGIPAGTTVVAFLTATKLVTGVPQATLLLSASATTSAADVTFGVDAPEGDEMAVYRKLRQNPVVRLTISTAGDNSLASISSADWTAEDILFMGMGVSCSNSSAGVVANTLISAVGPSSISINPSTSGATPADYDFQFSTGSALTRETTAPVADTLPALVVNWCIKY
jgi:microcystin-dependent protein